MLITFPTSNDYENPLLVRWHEYFYLAIINTFMGQVFILVMRTHCCSTFQWHVFFKKFYYTMWLKLCLISLHVNAMCTHCELSYSVACIYCYSFAGTFYFWMCTAPPYPSWYYCNMYRSALSILPSSFSLERMFYVSLLEGLMLEF